MDGVVSLTLIDIDKSALAEAMRLSGTRTTKETVNLALREFADRHRRVAALEESAQRASTWDLEDWQSRRLAEKEPTESSGIRSTRRPWGGSASR